MHLHRTLSKALKQDTDDSLIPRNGTAPVKPPRSRREEIRPLDREQVRALFETAREVGWKPSTSWPLPPGSLAANCRASSEKT